jgi:hypothetical protein
MNSVTPLDGLKATPEYGPGPYTPLHPTTDIPVCDVWEQTEGAAARLRMLFEQEYGPAT